MNLITSETLPIFWAGGSQVKITADGIFITTNGKFEVKAANHNLLPGKTVPLNLPELQTVPLCEECISKAAESGSSYIIR